MAEQTKRYDLSQFVFNNNEVQAGSFKMTKTMDTETYSSFNAYEPFCVSVNGVSYSWELSDIDPAQKHIFDEAFESQRNSQGELPIIATYNYDPATGDLIEDDVLYEVFISEISKENSKPFSAKGEALKLKKK